MEAISDSLRLLGDDTRIRILHLLEQEPLTVAELQELLGSRQSSVSSHLAKLRAGGLLAARTEGASHRYHHREDCPQPLAGAWAHVRGQSIDEPIIRADRERLAQWRAQSGASWVEQVAGSLHRSYAPGRTWQALGHGFLQLTELGACVDIGSGDGAMLDVLAPRCAQLTCVDPSPAMHRAACARLQQTSLQNVSCVQAAGEALPLADGSQDSALLLQSLQYVEQPALVLREAQRVLRPGGRLLLLTLLEHDFPESDRWGHRHRGFSPAFLRAQLSGCDYLTCYTLPAEDQAPPFQTLVACARRRTPKD